MKIEITPAQLRYLLFLEKHKIREENKMFISQNGAYKRFGRANIDRWVAEGKVQRFYRPRTIEYKMNELLSAAENQQDYTI
jgi:hypothetical protein